MVTAASAPVQVGVTYSSAAVGPYIWHEFDAASIATDLRAIAASGHHVVRTHLLWDAFMPTPDRADPRRLRDLERFLDLASAESLRVIPVLFAQSLGDCVMLPGYAIDVGGARPQVRVVCDAVVQPGGPRDVYIDALMLDAGLRWLDALLAGFAKHPGIVTWDLGHDPATTIRPRRTEHLRSWLTLMAGRVHDAGDTCMITLGSADTTPARAVRPAAAAGAVDSLGLVLDTEAIAALHATLDPGAAVFLSRLNQALSGSAPQMVHISAAGDADAVRRYTAGAHEGVIDAGSAAIGAAAWSDPGPRAIDVPPFDGAPEVRTRGVVDASGAMTAFGSAWVAQLRTEHARHVPSPWPDRLDVEAYYANLPDSLHDLHAAWRRGAPEQPAMLG